MQEKNKVSALILGLFLFMGLATLGYLLAHAAIQVKQYERTVRVKGLSEHEYPADIVIWPIQFTEASNQVEQLYDALDDSSNKIKAFLKAHGIQDSEITISAPSITDKSAQQYGNNNNVPFRYVAVQNVTVYSHHIDTVRAAMKHLSQLGKQGIVLGGNGYQSKPQYLFTRLNEVKPEMIEEATRNAREVAEKFAADSHSTLGKIKTASQGQFSISSRDQNNPHIKKVRVVSTVEYYLSD